MFDFVNMIFELSSTLHTVPLPLLISVNRYINCSRTSAARFQMVFNKHPSIAIHT